MKKVAFILVLVALVIGSAYAGAAGSCFSGEGRLHGLVPRPKLGSSNRAGN